MKLTGKAEKVDMGSGRLRAEGGQRSAATNCAASTGRSAEAGAASASRSKATSTATR